MYFKASTSEYFPSDNMFQSTLYTLPGFKRLQDDTKHNTHNKAKTSMMISIWTNPIAIFIPTGAWMTEQSQVKHVLLFCASVLLGILWRMFLLETGMPTSAVQLQYSQFQVAYECN